MQKVKTGLKIIIFIAVAAVLFCGVSYIVRPVWADVDLDAHSYDTIYGFYEEPENSIETIFLGTSVVVHGISPMELYEDYGISSYNLATQVQPMMASYYWLEEAYRFQSATLDTVVLDVSELKREISRKEAGADSAYKKAFEYMKFSKVKYHFLKDYSNDFTEFINNLFPIMSFHDRWKELTKIDFLEYQHELETYDLGYGLMKDISVNLVDSYKEISVPFYTVTDQTKVETNSEDLSYFIKIIEFCNDHNLHLVLIKTPQCGTNSWSDAAHNTVQTLADQYQLDFFDFNYLPYIEDINFNFATDSYDNIHMNHNGVVKFTDWLGNYLVETCGNKDIRAEEKYDFKEEELADYHREIIFSDLSEITNPVDYLADILEKEDYMIFISTKDDASKSLTEEQRESFEDMGLTKLSQITLRASYLAVIDEGVVITEQMETQDPENIDSININAADKESLCISYNGNLSDGTTFLIESGGYNMGNLSSIQIDGEEYSLNERGLNIVVYDKKLKQVVDEALFDTYASPKRDKPVNDESLKEAIQSDGTGALTEKLLELYLYDRLCEDTKTAKVLKQNIDGNNLSDYLQAFWDNEEFNIYMSANGDIANTLTNSQREALAKMGLTDLSEIEDGDSYLAFIREGKIETEQCDTDGRELEASGEIFKICSGNGDEEGECSLIVQGSEYVGDTEGLNIVIYDNVLDQVIDSTVYDINHTFVSTETN